MQGAGRGTRPRVSRIRPWAEGGAKPLRPPGALCCFVVDAEHSDQPPQAEGMNALLIVPIVQMGKLSLAEAS